VKVRGAVDNADERLKAEMFTVAELRVPAPGGYLVPSRAIYLRGEQYFVFVDEGHGRYARHAIVPGPISDGYQTVLGGIAASDKVVVDGNLLLERLLASKDCALIKRIIAFALYQPLFVVLGVALFIGGGIWAFA